MERTNSHHLKTDSDRGSCRLCTSPPKRQYKGLMEMGRKLGPWFRWERMRSELGLVCGRREGRAGRTEPGTSQGVKADEEGEKG